MKFTIKNILLLGAALLGIVAFFMMFVQPLHFETSFGSITLTGDPTFSDVYFAEDKPLVAPFIFFLFALLGGAAIVVSFFVPAVAKYQKWINLGVAGLYVVIAILLFCTKAFYCGVHEITNGADSIHLAAGPILGAIFCILGAGAIGVAEFVKLDK